MPISDSFELALSDLAIVKPRSTSKRSSLLCYGNFTHPDHPISKLIVSEASLQVWYAHMQQVVSDPCVVEMARNQCSCGAPGCNRFCPILKSLRQHGLSYKSAADTFSCGVAGCGRIFHDQRALLQHRTSAHSGPRSQNT
jgi:hypothetical protein